PVSRTIPVVEGIANLDQELVPALSGAAVTNNPTSRATVMAMPKILVSLFFIDLYFSSLGLYFV
ncbi:MAG: hypothetical protein ABUK06_04340, partial [Dehalococcoidales bacterium]